LQIAVIKFVTVWLYWAVLLIPMLVAVSYFQRTDPELLERRMKYKEKAWEEAAFVSNGRGQKRV
jgi:hypothetical protein